MESRYRDGSSRRPDVSAATRQGGAGMRARYTSSIRLLPLGAGPRLLGAALIVAALWGAFFWATSTPGGP